MDTFVFSFLHTTMFRCILSLLNFRLVISAAALPPQNRWLTGVLMQGNKHKYFMMRWLQVWSSAAFVDWIWPWIDLSTQCLLKPYLSGPRFLECATHMGHMDHLNPALTDTAYATNLMLGRVILEGCYGSSNNQAVWYNTTASVSDNLARNPKITPSCFLRY